MEETKLNELATQVASIIDEREGHNRQELYALVGGLTVFAGVGYFGVKLVRNAVDAHRLRKMKKAEQ